MLLKNRLFERQLPSREAKNIFIFCEGKRTEYNYFNYFKEIDSRINIVVYKLSSDENNSPWGLFNLAKKNILETDSKYDFREEIDEVWLVFDTDKDDFNSRDKQIKQVYEECSKLNNWFVAQSNPCFEVWLYYHKCSIIPQKENIQKCSTWKQIVNEVFKGGFDSRRHPQLFNNAIINSKSNFREYAENLHIGETEVYKLAEKIKLLLSEKIKQKFMQNVKNTTENCY